MRVELKDVKGARYQCTRGQLGNYCVPSTAVLPFGLVCFAELRETLKLKTLLNCTPRAFWPSSTQTPTDLYEAFLDHSSIVVSPSSDIIALVISVSHLAVSLCLPYDIFCIMFNFYLKHFTCQKKLSVVISNIISLDC